MKRILSALLALLLLCAPALAAEVPLVVDEAGLLSRADLEKLTMDAEALSARCGMDVVILTEDSIGDRAALDYAADWYDGRGYGQGAQHDGILLLISMEFRDWAIVTTGQGIDVFTDEAIDRIAEGVVPFLSDGDYAGGFERYLSDVETMLAQADGSNVIGGADAPVVMVVSDAGGFLGAWDAGGPAGALVSLSLLMLFDTLWTLQTGVI